MRKSVVTILGYGGDLCPNAPSEAQQPRHCAAQSWTTDRERRSARWSKIGGSYFSLYNMANGRTPLRNDILDAVRRYLNLPEEWPGRLTKDAPDALGNVQETYMIVYRNADRLPLIQPGDSLEIQPSALPRIGSLNLIRSGSTDVLAEIEVEAGELRADRDVDLATAAPVGYVVAVFSEGPSPTLIGPFCAFLLGSHSDRLTESLQKP